MEQITTGDRRLSAFSFSDDDLFMAFTSTDAVTPTELYVAPGTEPRNRRPQGSTMRGFGT